MPHGKKKKESSIINHDHHQSTWAFTTPSYYSSLSFRFDSIPQRLNAAEPADLGLLSQLVFSGHYSSLLPKILSRKTLPKKKKKKKKKEREKRAKKQCDLPLPLAITRASMALLASSRRVSKSTPNSIDQTLTSRSSLGRPSSKPMRLWDANVAQGTKFLRSLSNWQASHPTPHWCAQIVSSAVRLMNLILCATSSRLDAADILSARLSGEVMNDAVLLFEEGDGGERESNLPAIVLTRTSLNFRQQLPGHFAFFASITTERIPGSWLSMYIWAAQMSLRVSQRRLWDNTRRAWSSAGCRAMPSFSAKAMEISLVMSMESLMSRSRESHARRTCLGL